MQIDRRVTNGLAWAGALLVVAVPSIDYLTGQFAGAGTAAPASIAVIEPASSPDPAPLGQRPDAPKVAATGAVDSFIQSGRPLPSYITDAPATTPAAAPAPAPVATTPPAAATPATPTRPLIVTDPVQVAAVPPKVAPIPMPLSMRPRPVIATQPPMVDAIGAPIINPVAVAPSPEPVYVPPSVGRAPSPVTAADLEDWESGPLSEFLARRQQEQGVTSTPVYESEGFYLDEWNNRQPRGRDRLVGPGNEFFVPFGN
jgi:hypothetical protein